MSFFSSPKIFVLCRPFVFIVCNIPKNKKRSKLIYVLKQSSLTIVAMSSYQFLILDQYKAKVKPLFQMTQLCSKVFKSQKCSYKSQKSQNTKNIWICASPLPDLSLSVSRLGEALFTHYEKFFGIHTQGVYSRFFFLVLY